MRGPFPLVGSGVMRRCYSKRGNRHENTSPAKSRQGSRGAAIETSGESARGLDVRSYPPLRRVSMA